MGDLITKQRYRRSLLIVIFTLVLSAFSPLAMAADIPEELIPMGNTVGISIRCDGVMVVALGQVDTSEGTVSPAVDAGFAPGDIITHVNSDEINSLNDFQSAISKTPNASMTVRIKRDGSEMQLNLTPAVNNKGIPELGLWLRDGMAGIGTVTFYDPESGIFGALGHSINDVKAGSIMPLKSGTIMPAKIMSVLRGEAGLPGELQGEFDFDKSIGTIDENTQSGIFGTLAETQMCEGKNTMPVGCEKDIKLGDATILANVDGEDVKEYSIEVSRIFTGGDNRKLMITVTDEELLAATGGIVQGMSGSPIIQNGKIIGAVTHVLINNPEKGYGISMDSMLKDFYKDQIGKDAA